MAMVLRRAAITNKCMTFANETILLSNLSTMATSRLADQLARMQRGKPATILSDNLLDEVRDGHFVSLAGATDAAGP